MQQEERGLLQDRGRLEEKIPEERILKRGDKETREIETGPEADERVPRLLGRLNLRGFQLRDYRNLNDCEYRGPGFSSRLSCRAYELTFNHTFPRDYLVTVPLAPHSICSLS